jgi:NAD(P)-dependent dehydrogenase (short-subunit alcohol dehydrogenase family)
MEKFAVVTGGSSGLGLSIADCLKSSGFQVIVWDRTPSTNHSFIQCDVSDPSSVQRALVESLKLTKKFDVLVNSAGISIAIPTVSRRSTHELSAFEAVLKVNIIGLFDVTRTLTPYMKNGVIINIASMAASEGQRGQAAYAASKAAVAGLTMPLSRDLASRAVRVVCLCPGVFETPMAKSINPGVKEKILAGVALGRFGKPEELAHVVKMCVENQYLNGCCINLNGGGIFPNI